MINSYEEDMREQYLQQRVYLFRGARILDLEVPRNDALRRPWHSGFLAVAWLANGVRLTSAC